MRRPSPALLVALLALFVALGGPAQAKKLLVGSKQIKDHSIAGRDLQPAVVTSLRVTPKDGVTGRQVLNGSLDGKDVGRFAGVAKVTLGAEGTGCSGGTSGTLPPLAAGQDIANDAIVVTPPPNLPNGVTVTARAAGKDKLHVTACGAEPPGGDFNFRYVTMDVAG